MKATRLSLRKRIALELFKKYKDNQSKLHPLKYIFWECTLRCNLDCLHCGSDCSKNASVNDMPVKDFLKAIDDVTPVVEPNKTLIVMTGGEPLVRKDLEKTGMELYKRGFPWGLVTNGMLLTEKRFNALMHSGLRSITVSLDGLEKSHNWLRGNNQSFRKALEAIKLLPKEKNLRHDVVTCVNRKNFEELPQIRDKLIGMEVREWRIFTITPIGRAKDNDPLQLQPNEFKALFDFIRQTRKQGEIRLNYGCEGFLGNYESEVRDHFFFCRAGIQIASVLADGSISACPNLPRDFIQGNIYKDNFADIWQNRYRIFRERDWTKTGICSDCKFYKYCEGNGMHLRDGQTGDLLLCHLKKIEEGQKNQIE
ncbi:MAG: TIGR04133 family radical SAM/SPASM protein [Bacteroidales bacterium]|nr:TIGR04133 family radical SAM/SPASM protein [Bacteroidales bacterium]MCF8338572.1 TIGR04133 family radical SAM/SPASM protein [Bacteroidales bacterium]